MAARILFLLLFFSLSVSASDAKGDSVYSIINGEKVYRRVQTKPVYPGGNDSLLSYIDRHLQLPDKKTGGTITVRFIVSSAGKLHSVVILNDMPGHPEYAQEAKRVLLNMPVWKPAMHLGKKVSCYFTMPISFVVKDKAMGQ